MKCVRESKLTHCIAIPPTVVVTQRGAGLSTTIARSGSAATAFSNIEVNARKIRFIMVVER
jgi:hypothetical protein